jgi:prepilin-type N-terminal cleavage/methylation domain-containing protein
MNKEEKSSKTRGGFTILELLMVVSVMAIIATLATGAAVKSIKQIRERRVTVMRTGLEVALANYRASKNDWPFVIDDLVFDPRSKFIWWAHGKYNYKVFDKMYHGPNTPNKTVFLDESAFLTSGNKGKIKGPQPLSAALSAGADDLALGYYQPNNKSRFCYYCVCYNPATDTVKVYRQDETHPPLTEGGEGLRCPELPAGW